MYASRTVLALPVSRQHSGAMTVQWSALPDARQAAALGDYGTVVRLARQAIGLTQAQAGQLLGYSAASISRFETGAARLTDVAVLRSFADALGIPRALLGLSGHDSPDVTPPAGKVPEEARDGAMQRRDFLAASAGAMASAALPVPAVGQQEITGGLDELLFGTRNAGTAPVTADRLTAMLGVARRDFRACRYRELAGRLPTLIQTALATRDAQSQAGADDLETIISDAYALATEVLTKLHENGAAWATADRAIQAAVTADDPRALARAKRLAAIVLRRSAHRDQAQTLILDSTRQFAAATALAEPADAAFFAAALCTASYTAALADQRDQAYTLLREAGESIAEHGAQGFSDNNITSYAIGVARALGDYGNAIDYARKVNLDLLGSPERQARYWEDTAMAWWGRGRPRAAFEAVLRAERAAPQEVRYRPWAQRLTTQLLSSPAASSLTGLREFAARNGVA